MNEVFAAPASGLPFLSIALADAGVGREAADASAASDAASAIATNFMFASSSRLAPWPVSRASVAARRPANPKRHRSVSFNSMRRLRA